MKSTLLAFSVLFVAASAAACSEAEQNGYAGSSGGSASGGAGPGVTIVPWMGSGGSDTGETTTRTPGGGPCGGVQDQPCLSTEYCDYPGNDCAPRGAQGTCTPKPDVCPDVIAPVCACDGKVYDNTCIAQLAGVDIQTLGGCPAPDDLFPCGAEFCEPGAEFCQIDLPGQTGEPTVTACVPLPPNCQVPGATCACLADLPCASSCEQDTQGGFTLTCP